ncbi:synaptotagmin-13 isoform X1 [Alligator mississippiensis]|uniref:Synaptotagmin-13 n=2 Tax=Alligator mississippiensis TaxID=8496 RepID=A0A151MB90_ALLMI|nr:synaptotagmin-13 isoform X1 [Alligator mississippiensis]KYO21796.1 synaptotagmin-13 [Alligator mississippiensis]
MVLSAPVIALGATLGTATSILALCGLTCFCKSRQPRKGLSGKDQDEDLENAKPSVLQPVQQFNIKKTAEPVQPRTLLKFPNIYGPKPVVTSPEVVNYTDYALKTTEEPTKGKHTVLDENRMKIQVNEELFVLPQNVPGVVKDVCVTERLNPERAASCNQVPELQYSLGYDRQKAELCVAFLEAMHGSMIGDQDPGSHCYILGTVVTKSGITEAQTELKKKALHTIWEEALLFPVAEEEMPEGTLTLTLRTCDKFSRHSIVGELKLSLAEVGEPFGTAQWEKLKTLEKVPSTGYGEVLLSISYLPAANRLLVVIIKAKNLHSKQLKVLLGNDVFVKVTLKHQSVKLKKKQTKHAKHKINPVWNEMIMFEVPHELLRASTVELEMMTQESRGQNQSLGKCSLGLHATSTEKNHWEEMLRNPRRQIAMWHQLHM